MAQVSEKLDDNPWRTEEKEPSGLFSNNLFGKLPGFDDLVDEIMTDIFLEDDIPIYEVETTIIEVQPMEGVSLTFTDP